MKLKFKKQEYQTKAVNAVVDSFKGQPKIANKSYRVDPGNIVGNDTLDGLKFEETTGFENAEIAKTLDVLSNIQKVQKEQNLPMSQNLVSNKISTINLDIEMETGTGKTYCYIKTMFELNEKYGWNKFIIVVPSIAIREGVYKSLEITKEHFLDEYKKNIKSFIYNSKQLHNLESYSTDSGINVMVINVQAFNARGKDNRRIYEELDDFQSRRPIDVIKANRPILILDEPQKMEGKKTLDSLKEFNPLMILRYSATHKTSHNKIHRLDALDAYNQKLVKKISVRGISVKGLTGTNSYLYLEKIEISKDAPNAKLEMEIKLKSGSIVRKVRNIKKGNNLFDISEKLPEYQDGFVVSDINAVTDTISFVNGIELKTGEAIGNVNEEVLRRIQIRETISAHFAKEEMLFNQGVKVLSLFFIDKVSKYRKYADDSSPEKGEYAKIFEEEYNNYLAQPDLPFNKEYQAYLNRDSAEKVHNGYFSIDKNKRMVDPKTGKKSTETDDVNAYDLILKEKEKLLSFEEPTRFIFSHSALREGWDNPNVFVICTLKHSDNIISRRQEVGRGLRICVDCNGNRMDNPETVHKTNVLTVVTSESYTDFVTALQRDISDSLSERPRIADEKYFTDKILNTETGEVEVTAQMAKHIYRYLMKNDYTDDDDKITEKYHNDKAKEIVAELPEDLKPYQEEIFQLIDTVFNGPDLDNMVDDDREKKKNPLNDNFKKKEFQELWARINSKARYKVYFDNDELVEKSINAFNNLRVTQMAYQVEAGTQKDELSYDELKSKDGFEVREKQSEYYTASSYSKVKYDLVGQIAEPLKLTRNTVGKILQKIKPAIFAQFKQNPEEFISESIRLINEQKATMVVEKLTYDMVDDRYDSNIFTDEQANQTFSKAGKKLNKHIYDFVITDSKIEEDFATELEVNKDVVLYTKLPRAFYIPTPVGHYNPDWAIAFKEGSVKHIYFVAETKGSMSSMQLREIEKTKIECAKKFFNKIGERFDEHKVKYDVVKDYDSLIKIVK